jgi:uncharacterized repeat protein (TIGR01451 family)
MKTQATVNAAPSRSRWGAPRCRSRALALGGLLLILGLGAARPAWALTTISTDTTISTTISDDVQVTGSANVNIVSGGLITGNLTAYNSSAVTLAGGQVSGTVTANDSSMLSVLTGSYIGNGLVANGSCTVNISGGSIPNPNGSGLVVNDGAVNISGGTIAGMIAAVAVSGGTANISGGSLSGSSDGVLVTGGAVSVTGGSIAGGSRDLFVAGGTVNVFGCGLQLSGGTLSGTLEDGTAISMTATVNSPGQVLLNNQLTQISPPADRTVATDPNSCTASLNPGTATAASECGSIPSVAGVRSDQQPLSASYPLGITTITWTATDGFGQQSQAQQTVTVVDTQKPALTLPASQTVNATSAVGAPVSFTVTASDNCGTPTLVCTDQNGQVVTSGMTFPIGTTVVTCTATDGNGNQTSGSFSITVAQADLAISLGASPMPVKNKQNLTYTLRVSNTGPTTATGVVISDPLPADTTFLSATASAGVTLNTPPVGTNGALVGKLTSLAPNGSPVTVTLTVAVNTKKTSISNTASVSAGTPDPVASNNTATLAVAVK